MLSEACVALIYFGSAESRDNVLIGKKWVDSSSLVLFPISKVKVILRQSLRRTKLSSHLSDFPNISINWLDLNRACL
jgi:hypothetical protein